MAIKAKGYQSELMEILGVGVRITSYQIGKCYLCQVDHTDSGSIIARGEGGSHDESQKVALSKTTHRIADQQEKQADSLYY